MYKLSFLAICGLVLGFAMAASAADKRVPGGTVTGYIVAIEKNANGTGTITIQSAGRAEIHLQQEHQGRAG
jgi:predicted RNase H-like nuclease